MTLGSNIWVYVNGTLLGSVNDSSYLSGKVGVGTFDQSSSPYSVVEFDFATLLVVESVSAVPLYFPHFDQGSEWWTGLTLANPGSSAASVTVKAFDMTGAPIGIPTTLSIPAGAQAPPALVSDLLGVSGTGWIRVTATQPIVGAMFIGRWHDASMDALLAQMQ